MKIYNPTKNDIKVSIQGVEYTLEAEGELSGVPTAHAEYWKSRLHAFLVVSAEDNDADITLKSAKTEDPVTETETETEEVAEEVVEEKPKATKKTTKKTTTKKAK